MATRFLRVSPLIPARDVEEAIRFYRDALGFELDYRDAEPAQFAIVGRDSAWPTRPACESSSMASMSYFLNDPVGPAT